MIILLSIALVVLFALGTLGGIALSKYTANNIGSSIVSQSGQAVFLHTGLPGLVHPAAQPSFESTASALGFYTFFPNAEVDPPFIPLDRAAKLALRQPAEAALSQGGYTEALLISRRDNPYVEPAEEIIQGEATWYCACAICNGGWTGLTAGGESLEGFPLRYDFCGCNWLPLGSWIMIRFAGGGWTPYLVADRGSKQFDTIGRVDIFEPRGHRQTMKNGRQDIEIMIISGGEK